MQDAPRPRVRSAPNDVAKETLGAPSEQSNTFRALADDYARGARGPLGLAFHTLRTLRWIDKRFQRIGQGLQQWQLTHYFADTTTTPLMNTPHQTRLDYAQGDANESGDRSI